jgi:ATP-dependent DNA ligase
MARVSSARLSSLPTRDPAFIEPMECLAVAKLPDAPGWVWEIKLDGYRAVYQDLRVARTRFPFKTHSGRDIQFVYPSSMELP